MDAPVVQLGALEGAKAVPVVLAVAKAALELVLVDAAVTALRPAADAQAVREPAWEVAAATAKDAGAVAARVLVDATLAARAPARADAQAVVELALLAVLAVLALVVADVKALALEPAIMDAHRPHR